MSTQDVLAQKEEYIKATISGRNFRVYLLYPATIFFYAEVPVAEAIKYLDILESKVTDLTPEELGS